MHQRINAGLLVVTKGCCLHAAENIGRTAASSEGPVQAAARAARAGALVAVVVASPASLPIWNRAIIWVKFAACSLSDCAAAVACSTSAAFCCVPSSIAITTLFTCSIPEACSWLEAAIAATTSVTFFTPLTISCNTLPEASTSFGG